jgi:hypothetical protein
VGIILGIANISTLGFIGFSVVTIFFNQFRILFSFLPISCSGESCLGPIVLIDSIILILASLLMSLFFSLNYKHFIQKRKTSRTKILVICDVILIVFILFNMLSYLKMMCLSNESCIVKISNIYGPESICKNVDPQTRFSYDKKNPSSINSFGYGENGCYSKMALINKDELFCTESPNKRVQDRCYSQLSRVSADISLCKKISVGGYEDNPNETVGMNYFAQWDRDYCYKNIASLTGDVSVCKLIKNNDNKQLCLAILYKDENYCENIDKGQFMMSAGARTECENFFK